MLGQIIYNVEDYGGSGGLVSTSKTDPSNRVYSTINGSYNNNYDYEKINIFEDVFKGIGSDITKLGIQAPPGTKFQLNASSLENEANNETIAPLTIMVGRTGVYELDDGLKINSLTFERPKVYSYDKDASQNAINAGRAIMENAKYTFDQRCSQLQPLLDSAISTDSQKNYWEEYQKAHKEYVDSYNKGRMLYIQGISGIYNEASGLADIHNVIIDFVYTTIMEGSN